jgi:6-phosphogluconolactonase
MTTYRVYIGTYTNKESKGVYLSEFDSETGELAPVRLVAELEMPTWVSIHPDGRTLYAAHDLPETSVGGQADGGPEGAISAFRIDSESGNLTFKGQQSSMAVTPCHLAFDATARYIMVANFRGVEGGVVAMYPLGADGELLPASCTVQHRGSSVHPKRQAGPHAHSVTICPNNRFAYAADLGADKVFIYRMDLERGQLVPNDPPSVSLAAGAGPRHFAFNPNGRNAYVINEVDSTMTAFAWDAKTGALNEIQTLPTLPEGEWVDKSHCADVHISADGRHLYGSNRGHDSIALFYIDEATGLMTPGQRAPSLGGWPRNFLIAPSGRHMVVANQEGDNLVTFDVDSGTGELTPTECSIPAPSPVCVQLTPIK